MIADNTALAPYYERLFATHLSVRFGDVGLDKSLLHWINDGLMAVFFLLVGLEIKREVLRRRAVAARRRRRCRSSARIGGMLVPAAIYVAFNRGDADLAARLGDPGGDRHRLLARRAGAAGQPRAALAEGIPDRRSPIFDDLGAIVGHRGRSTPTTFR